MSTLPPEILQSLSEDGQRRYLNSFKQKDDLDQTGVDTFSFQTPQCQDQQNGETESNEEIQQRKNLSLICNVSYSESTTTSNVFDTINSAILPLLPLSTENSNVVHTPSQSFPILKHKIYSNNYNHMKNEIRLTDLPSQQSDYTDHEQKDDMLSLQYYNSVSVSTKHYSLVDFPSVDFPDVKTEFKKQFELNALIDLYQSVEHLVKIYLPEESYEIITCEYYTAEELIDIQKLNINDGQIEEEQTTDASKDMYEAVYCPQKIYLPEECYEIITYEYYFAEERIEIQKNKEIEEEKLVDDKSETQQEINELNISGSNDDKEKEQTKECETVEENGNLDEQFDGKIAKENDSKQEEMEKMMNQQEKRLFVDVNPKIETKKPENEKEKEKTEVYIDPFAVYLEFPQNPQDSLQIQRLALLLSQYQCFNDIDKNQCVYRFICDGNIDEYNETLLLNDWYYTLVHYCDDTMLFQHLYKYFTLQIGTKCDIEHCAIIRRNYEKHPSSKKYYGFTEYKQQTRIRLLDNIHCHILHSYDIGFKLTKSEKEYVEFGDGYETNNIDPTEINLLDEKMVRLKRSLVGKKQNLKKIIGLKRLRYNKFVTQMFEENHNRKQSMLDIPVINSQSKRPTKIEINDNYQFGQKFYYWKYHKKAGWKWYISAKFKDLKTEMISNKLLSMSEWNMYYNESTHMLSTFLSKSYVPMVEKYFGTYFYGIRDGDKLSISHILSVLVFCTDYNLQIILNKSYTKRSNRESDTALRQRHSYYANWAKLLCETVEVFVNNTFYKSVDDFYHGTNCCMHFNEIYASLYAPTSMTRSLSVATGYSNEQGLLLHFMHGNEDENINIRVNNNRYFECNWISSWSNENEILFVGSAAPLKFKSVINCLLSHNYSHYISAISQIEEMLSGNPIPIPVTVANDNNHKAIQNAMLDLIDYQLKKEKKAKFHGMYSIIGRHSAVKIADYIYEAFNHFVKNSMSYHIQFDLYSMNNDYKHVQHFFFTKNRDWIKFKVLCKLFVNIKYLSILPLHGAENYALKLTRERMITLSYILKQFGEDNENKLERISIDEPNTTELKLKSVIKDFKSMFEAIGWKISCFGWKKYDSSIPQLIIAKNKKSTS